MVIPFVPPSASLGLVRVRGPWQGVLGDWQGGEGLKPVSQRVMDPGSGRVTLLMFLSSPTSCFGVSSPQGEGLAWEELAAPRDVFLGPARCPAPYTFSFEMLVTGPCLLAGGCPFQGS